MSSAPTAPAGLVPDANVLIDYANTEPEILSLIAKRLGDIYIPSPVLAEVRQMSLRHARRLNLNILEPSFAQAAEAANMTDSTISFEDRLCLIVARDNGWSCLTNDKRLRRACRNVGVSIMWGMESMRLLVTAGHMRADRAANTAKQMAQTNPCITDAILKRFLKQIGC